MMKHSSDKSRFRQCKETEPFPPQWMIKTFVGDNTINDSINNRSATINSQLRKDNTISLTDNREQYSRSGYFHL